MSRTARKPAIAGLAQLPRFESKDESLRRDQSRKAVEIRAAQTAWSEIKIVRPREWEAGIIVGGHEYVEAALRFKG
jgi:hypothetical protein